MKTNIPTQLLRFALIASLAAAPLARAGGDEDSTATVKLSDPGKPATLSLDVPWADIRIIGVDGELSRTRMGELTIFAEDVTFLTKALETPPDKWKGLRDPEKRYRQRYIDLVDSLKG